MSFERSPFGDGTLVGSGGNVTTNVNNHYGTRKSTRAQGKVKTEGTRNEVSFEVSGTDVGNDAFPLLVPSLPAGAVIETAYVKVKEAFVVGGTSPTINFGTEGSETTNGIEVSEAQAEAVGTYDVTSTLAGTWGSPLAASTVLGIAMDGTSPTVTSAGLLEVVITYSVV